MRKYFYLLFVLIQPVFASNHFHSLLNVSTFKSIYETNKQNPNYIVIDVRTPSEYNGGHIDGAININYYDSDFEAQVAALDTNRNIMIHCQSGGRSGSAFDKVTKLGFDTIYDMSGGMNAWNSAGYAKTTTTYAKLITLSYTDITLGIGPNTSEIILHNQGNKTLHITNISSTNDSLYVNDFDTIILPRRDVKLEANYNYQNSNEPFETLSITGSDATVLNFRFDAITPAIEEQPSETTFTVYPNPGNGFYNCPQADAIYVYNILGNLIFSKQNTNHINISSETSGLYYYRMFTNNKEYTGTLIKR